MPSRMTNAEEVAQAFVALGVDAAALSATMVKAGGRRLRVAAAAHPTPAEAEAIGRSADFVVADRLSAAARARLNDARVGWLDRRGHLRVHVPGLIVDSDVPRLVPPQSRRSETLGETGLDIAVTLLAEPERTWGVNELARHLTRSAGRVSEVLGALKDQGLVTPAASPLIPELFWAAADAWRPRWMPLSAVPEDPEGARLSGGRAAAALGAGVVLTADWPLELYLADVWTLRNLAAEPPSGRARVVGAACPSPAALGLRPAGHRSRFPLAHPVVIALDLAQDRARGREILEGWSPPRYARVW
ncbi:MAG: helix-turn-helix domain-containing protein [Acidimicrobiales bacterium]